MAGLLHDIGKIAMSNEILNKCGRLNDAEWMVLKRHPEVGYSILTSVNDYASLAECVLTHHERWDGTGYPQRLKGEEIPFYARIISVADAFAAMTSDRPYRKAMSEIDAIQAIKAESGKQFDPKIVKVFLEIVLKEEKMKTYSYG